MELRDYQKHALQSWAAAGYKSILAMATGTGKTFTAISGAIQVSDSLKKAQKSNLILVVCPYLHLADQWRESFATNGVEPQMIYESSKVWESHLSRLIDTMNAIPGKSEVLITTLATFRGNKFNSYLNHFNGEIIFIADEAHNFAGTSIRKHLPTKARFRLGLTATPDLEGNLEGTQILTEYFGPTSFKIDLKDAISLGVLTPYLYYPRVCMLSETETETYALITKQIVRLLHGREWTELSQQESIKFATLLRARAGVLGAAEAKWEPFLEDVKSNFQVDQQLIYCPEGKDYEADTRHIVNVGKLLANLGLSQAIYEAATPRLDRQALLKQFAAGKIRFLLSMRCLDEGVDVPSATTAYILASSNNPRQFIQRRGRILRKAKDKHRAQIYDYFVMPSPSLDASLARSELSIVEREMRRAEEFISAAMNPIEASRLLDPLRKRYERIK